MLYAAVSIAEEPETITPLSGLTPPVSESARPKQFKTNISEKRMTGRPVSTAASSSRLSLISLNSMDEPTSVTDTSTTQKTHDGNAGNHIYGEKERERVHHHHRHHGHGHDSRVIHQVYEWLQGEKAKRAKKKGKAVSKEGLPSEGRQRSGSGSSESSAVGLEKLQKILEDGIAAMGGSVESLTMGSPNLGEYFLYMPPLSENLGPSGYMNEFGFGRIRL